MSRAAALLLLLAATAAAPASDDGWFFFLWDAETGRYARSQKVYRSLNGCERARFYQATATDARLRYLTFKCQPADDATPVPPNAPPVQVIVR